LPDTHTGCLRLGRPGVKSAKALEAAKVQGQLQAAAKFRKTKAGTEAILMEHLENMVDRIDPMELAAVGVTAIVVKDMLDSVPEFVQNIKDKLPTINPDTVLADTVKAFNDSGAVNSNILLSTGVYAGNSVLAWIKSTFQTQTGGAGTR